MGLRAARLLSDARLAQLAAGGDERAFEVLYDRHHRALLGFCRHMVGSPHEAEDALQQTFLRAHRALLAHGAPDDPRPWLFTIARNRCKTLLAARRAEAEVDERLPATAGLAEEVQARADLRAVVEDVARLPDDQRAALVLSELADLSHAQIGEVIGVRAAKVKALVHQARTTLIAERDAREQPCDEIREQIATARGGALRRGPLRRHLRLCAPCRAYRDAVADAAPDARGGAPGRAQRGVEGGHPRRRHRRRRGRARAPGWPRSWPRARLSWVARPAAAWLSTPPSRRRAHPRRRPSRPPRPGRQPRRGRWWPSASGWSERSACSRGGARASRRARAASAPPHGAHEAVSRRDEALARRDEKLAALGAPGTRGRGNATKPVKVQKTPGSSRSPRAPAKKAHPDKAPTQPANLRRDAGVVRPESVTRTKGSHECHAVC